MVDQRSDSERRPSPEALLELARREEHRAGKLKIFVGAAPGVGKTYEMLQTARAKLNEGVDVVAGVVETHGRKETEALLEGFEILPRDQQTPDALAAYQKAEIEKWWPIIKEFGIKAE